MKLGKLLGAGKSFFGWQGAVAYRENKRVYLPKFNPGANPFASKSEKAESAPLVAAVTPSLPSMDRVSVAALVAPVVVVASPVAPAPVASAPVAPAPVTSKASPFSTASAAGPARTTNWAEKFLPFRTAKPTKAAAVSMPNVQPEFSLNAIKVVHNDLSDADVEVVPMKSRSAGQVQIPAAPVPMEFLGTPAMKSI